MENKYEITKSFSKTIQLRQFEPISHFCSVKQGFDKIPSLKEKEKVARDLIQFAEKEVELSIERSIREKEDGEYINAESDLLGVKFKKKTDEQREEWKEAMGGSMGEKTRNENGGWQRFQK